MLPAGSPPPKPNLLGASQPAPGGFSNPLAMEATPTPEPQAAAKVRLVIISTIQNIMCHKC